MTLHVRKIGFKFILTFIYAVFIYILHFSYKLHNSTAEWVFPYEIIAEIVFFLLLWIYLKGLDRWIYCLLAVLLFSASAGAIHFYFSENYGNVDWQGISGAKNVVATHAMFSTWIFLIVAAFVYIARFVIKIFSIHRLGHH